MQEEISVLKMFTDCRTLDDVNGALEVLKKYLLSEKFGDRYAVLGAYLPIATTRWHDLAHPECVTRWQCQEALGAYFQGWLRNGPASAKRRLQWRVRKPKSQSEKDGGLPLDFKQDPKIPEGLQICSGVQKAIDWIAPLLGDLWPRVLSVKCTTAHGQRSMDDIWEVSRRYCQVLQLGNDDAGPILHLVKVMGVPTGAEVVRELGAFVEPEDRDEPGVCDPRSIGRLIGNLIGIVSSAVISADLRRYDQVSWPLLEALCALYAHGRLLDWALRVHTGGDIRGYTSLVPVVRRSLKTLCEALDCLTTGQCWDRSFVGVFVRYTTDALMTAYRPEFSHAKLPRMRPAVLDDMKLREHLAGNDGLDSIAQLGGEMAEFARVVFYEPVILAAMCFPTLCDALTAYLTSVELVGLLAACDPERTERITKWVQEHHSAISGHLGSNFPPLLTTIETVVKHYGGVALQRKGE